MTTPNAAPAVPRYRQPDRRWAEFGLLVFAFVVGAAAYIQVDLAVLDLEVTERRLAGMVPVDQAIRAIDQAVLVQPAERLADRPRRDLVHREAAQGEIEACALRQEILRTPCQVELGGLEGIYFG